MINKKIDRVKNEDGKTSRIRKNRVIEMEYRNKTIKLVNRI